MQVKRQILYPLSFIKTVPVPEQWDRRPLPNLIYKASNSENELTRLENWYRWLRSGQKKDLKKRLRSLSYRGFWSAYAELMVSRVAHELGAVSVKHSPLLWDKRPDLMVNFASQDKQIWEVAAAYQTKSREHDDDMAHELASRMNREFQHRWNIIVDATGFYGGGMRFNQAKPIIQAWLDQLEHGGPTELTISPPKINFELKLTASQKPYREKPTPIVKSLMGHGGNLFSTDRLKEVLRKKIKKYRGVADAKLPLVVFLFEGNWLHIDPFSLEGALWGQQTVNFSRISENSSLGVQEGGLFLPGPDGRPQNTRLSAVVYCRRVWHDEGVHSTLNVYHNPSALCPINSQCFSGVAQCQAICRETEIETTWDYERDTRMLRLN
jgi:hypothetical protein